jgi:murein DD-endopeptidase MepM/ murein hydrolase activator NlpD
MARKPDKKSGTPVVLAGLGGFLLGAATILLVVWVYTTQARNRTVPPVTVPEATPVPQTVPQTAPQTAPPGQPPAPQPTPPAQTVPAPTAPSLPPPAPSGPVSTDLAAKNLIVPVQGIRAEQLSDTFNQSRGNGERRHEALDIMAPRGTPVLATEDGTVMKLFTSKQGGLTIYEFDPTTTYAYYYAHLDRYAEGLREGSAVRRGQVIGYVGFTGNASPDGPHLHFAVFRLTPEKQWWKGEPINPFGLLR